MTPELATDTESHPDDHFQIPVPKNSYATMRHANPAPDSDSLNTGLRLISAQSDELGFRHMKYQAVYKGIPVWGAETIIHLDERGHIYRVDGGIPDIDTEINIYPELDEQSASSVALTHLRGDDWSNNDAQLFIYLTQDSPSLVWQIECINATQVRFILVDATTGEIVKTIAGGHT